ncbi:MAG: NhaC family Na+:H+ antiporter [Pseudohongiellaceae bacterium]
MELDLTSSADSQESTTQDHNIPLSIAVLPLLILIVLLTMNVYIFGDDAISGSNQIVLVMCAAVCAGLALAYGIEWKAIEHGMVNSLRIATPAMLILLMVGALSGTWMVSGIIPTMIYYGLEMLSPQFFLVSSCVISALVAVFTGSSWTTSATIGIALMGIGGVLGVSPGMSAGAILSGAYFGDKMSPLSDTTNLAAGTTGTELFTHIRYMMITTIPSISITLILFVGIGLFSDTGSQAPDTTDIQLALNNALNISGWLLLAPLAILLMIIKKVPALPAIFMGALLGGVFAVLFQTKLVASLGEGEFALYSGLMHTAYTDVSIQTGHPVLDDLLTSGGMSGMLGTIWLIIAAMMFGGAMEGAGFLRRITEVLVARAHSAVGLVSATAGTCIVTNVTASDQYLAVVVPGRMFISAFKSRSLASQNLSRTLEDSGTVTSVLIPWNTCGAYHATVLGVATLSYAPFAFFCLISPLMTVLVSAFNYRLAKTTDV